VLDPASGNQDFLKQMGADVAIDYTKTKFAENNQLCVSGGTSVT